MENQALTNYIFGDSKNQTPISKYIDPIDKSHEKNSNSKQSEEYPEKLAQKIPAFELDDDPLSSKAIILEKNEPENLKKDEMGLLFSKMII